MLNENTYAGEFLLAEGNGSISREEVTLAITATDLPAGTVLGKLTVGGAYAPYDAAVDPADGSETAVAILYAGVSANVATQPGVIIARHAEVNGSLLTGIDAGGIADLAAVDIIVR